MATITESIPIISPPKLRGALIQSDSFDVTPVIGTEFRSANLKEWLEAPKSDELLRDLAITISQQGVVYFRKRDGLDNDLQKKLAQRLGELSGKLTSSKLHIRPASSSGRRSGSSDDGISVISSEEAKQLYAGRFDTKKQSSKEGWHSDITFEPIPSDYAIPRLTELPTTGGDTLWASGYELYDRISPAYQKFVKTLTVTCEQLIFIESAENNNFELYSGERGSPKNTAVELRAVRPVLRTNLVSGWKSIFAMGHHAKQIYELTESEGDHLRHRFVQLITENDDLQVRY